MTWLQEEWNDIKTDVIDNCWKATGLLSWLSVSTEPSLCTERMIENEVSDLVSTRISHQRRLLLQNMINDEAEIVCTAHSDQSVSLSAIIVACRSRDAVAKAEDAEEDE